ncbi:MAG: hypothetical protein WBQ69_13935 [Gallionella sp.]
MELKEIADNLEKRRVELLKNNAKRAQQQAKNAQAMLKMKQAKEQLLKSQGLV